MDDIRNDSQISVMRPTKSNFRQAHLGKSRIAKSFHL